MKIQGTCKLLKKKLQISKQPLKLIPRCSKQPLLHSITGRVGKQQPLALQAGPEDATSLLQFVLQGLSLQLQIFILISFGFKSLLEVSQLCFNPTDSPVACSILKKEHVGYCGVLHLNTLLTLVFLPQQLVLSELYKLALVCASSSVVS